MPKVTMIGLGYIGLPTAALIASKGINVKGFDVNNTVINTINKGNIHIVEPELDTLVSKAVKEGFLIAENEVFASNVFLVAVPTPFKENNQPDLSYVESAIRNIIPVLSQDNLVIIESTSPVGTTHKMMEIIISERPELEDKFFMAYCPERVLPGNVIYELEHNDRVIGGINESSTEAAIDFYKLFVKGALHKTDAKTAEMCKLVENSSRDVQIAFANELSMICDEAKINVWELIKLANKHPRVNILQPGTGVGGHCIAVDPWFIVSEFPEQSKLIRSAREINNYKTVWVVEKIRKSVLAYELKFSKKPTIACMGLAFKPNIDDLRESPALQVAQELINLDVEILCVEPNIEEHKALRIYSMNDAISQADIIVYLVGHDQFKDNNNQGKIVLDFVNLMK
jgi:UDP-N-acetyl-D-mannosaminuronic acid dehydrogenase